MAEINVLIPTCKEYLQVKPQVEAIKRTAGQPVRVIATCQKLSAAQNRNIAHQQADSEIIIMMDDDIEGFYDGWVDDLIKPMVAVNEISMLTARYLRRDGNPAHMMSGTHSMIQPIIKITKLPTACFVYRKSEFDSIMTEVNKPFDESFRGSGFEDDDICIQMKKHFPDKYFALNNQCKLIHVNEMKNQKGANWEFNKSYIMAKYPDHPKVWN